ncbi:glyoxylase-like metal-dependent hydrolase (beta-lactamase superfamily II) [Leifsonia sp. AK011]|uniref:MBL fold metallo-hydrolase n=1 Tax=Leifsonia sp. AK011 TaxID=2723075 RepID=UPI00181CCE3D|nr:MBL fold metallo-hydrolase [Leifsonia sp. AK011]NYF10900.1 glyoxylase-like metal-dependent hydrolase (beta-lactamase superfamily II) [Leifsonia sp. AK011]
MRVSVISTGTVRIRPDHVEGRGVPVFWWLLTSRRWTAPRPINVFVIEHPTALVLFDTGQDRRSVTDAAYFPRGIVGFLYRRLARFSIAAGETLPALLADRGYDIGAVRYAVLSHLHQDHIGGLRDLRHAEIVVSDVEWRQVSRRTAVLDGYLADHILLPASRVTRVTPVSTEDPSIAPFAEAHDLLGDGSLLLVPTPGHSPGSLSLLLRRDGEPPLLFVGDLTYDVELLAEGRVPGVGSRSGLRASSRLVAEFVERNPGTVVLAAHDPAAAALLADASVVR